MVNILLGMVLTALFVELTQGFMVSWSVGVPTQRMKPVYMMVQSESKDNKIEIFLDELHNSGFQFRVVVSYNF